MSQSELAEHQGYLADERKIAAYRDALAEVVEPGDTVLDLGAGSGLLGYLACEAGAGVVVAVDQGDIVGTARQIAADNGYADRITHLQALSTELTLDHPVDVAVCDQIGGLVHDAGILTYFADARKRLLGHGARLVPASFRIFFAPVTFDRGRDGIEFWSSAPSSIDVSAARPLAANTEWRYNIAAEDATALAASVEVAAIASDSEDAFGGTAAYEVIRDGRFDGFLGWFEASMSPSVTLTNDPWSPDRFSRWCNYYPIDTALDLGQGDRVRLEVDVRPRLGVVTWSTEVAPADGSLHRVRQSSFESSFLTSTTVDAASPTSPVPANRRLDLARAVLEMVDGERSRSDIVAALTAHVGDGFASAAHLERFVRDLTAVLRL